MINNLASDNYNYKLDWNPSRLRSSIKDVRNKKKGKSFYTSDEVKSLLLFIKESKKNNTMCFYHAYRLGVSIGLELVSYAHLKRRILTREIKL